MGYPRPKPYRAGDHLAICDICGFEYYGSQLRKNWQGLMVCNKDFETKHPQLNPRTRIDKISVNNPRPEPDPVYITPGTNDVTIDDVKGR